MDNGMVLTSAQIGSVTSRPLRKLGHTNIPTNRPTEGQTDHREVAVPITLCNENSSLLTISICKIGITNVFYVELKY